MGFFGTIWKGIKSITGIQAYQNRKEANRLIAEAESLYNETMAINDERRKQLNARLNEFGNIRLQALKSTLKPFLECLTIMKKKYLDKEFELSANLDFKTEDIQKLESIELGAEKSIIAVAGAGASAAIALAGVPAMATSAAVAAAGMLGIEAGTGVAIGSLHGAAAVNATLAWLGGGTVASGGGGMAAGSAIISGIAGASAGLIAIGVCGLFATWHYSKQLTNAEEYLAKIQEFRAQSEISWEFISGIEKRVDEMERITLSLQERIKGQLALLYPLVFDFVSDDEYYVTTFQNTYILTKLMSELSQVPILDEKGFISSQSTDIINKINKTFISNREL